MCMVFGSFFVWPVIRLTLQHHGWCKVRRRLRLQFQYDIEGYSRVILFRQVTDLLNGKALGSTHILGPNYQKRECAVTQTSSSHIFFSVQKAKLCNFCTRTAIHRSAWIIRRNSTTFCTCDVRIIGSFLKKERTSEAPLLNVGVYF